MSTYKLIKKTLGVTSNFFDLFVVLVKFQNCNIPMMLLKCINHHICIYIPAKHNNANYKENRHLFSQWKRNSQHFYFGVSFEKTLYSCRRTGHQSWIMLATVSALIQCVYSIFQNDFLGRTQFKFCAFYSRILPKKWTFDPKMRILLQFQQGAQSIQAE